MSPIVSHGHPTCLPSHCLPTSVPMLDGVSAFPSSCLPLSPFVSQHVCLCWMVCPPSQVCVSHCLSWSPHMCACVRWRVRLPKLLSPLVSHCSPACLPACLPSCLPSCFPPCLPWSLFLFPFLAGGLTRIFPQAVYFWRFFMISTVFDPVPQKTS